MWKYVQRHNYFYNFDLENEMFWYTDLNSVYVEKDVTKTFIKTRFKNLNPRVDFEEDLVVESLSKIPTTCIIHKEENLLILNLKLNVDCDTFLFFWKLEPMFDKIKQMLIHPLLLALNSLSSQNDELLNIIRKKDSEIEQYKIEGAVLQRRLIATKKFNKLQFDSNYIHLNLKGFAHYSSNNLDSLKESCTKFIEKIEYPNPSTTENHSVIESSNKPVPDKKVDRSRRKRAFESRRKQKLEKIKNADQELVYEDSYSSS